MSIKIGSIDPSSAGWFIAYFPDRYNPAQQRAEAALNQIEGDDMESSVDSTSSSLTNGERTPERNEENSLSPNPFKVSRGLSTVPSLDSSPAFSMSVDDMNDSSSYNYGQQRPLAMTAVSMTNNRRRDDF